MAILTYLKNPLVTSLSAVTAVTAGVAGYAVYVNLPAKPALNPAVALVTAKTPAPQGKSGPGPAPAAPKFDIVRVEPSGATVVAGRTRPGADVDLIDNGQKLASAKADANGQFVILPKALPQGSHVLALSSTVGAQGPVASSQTVVVSVAPKAAGGTMVALASPGQPTRLLNPPAASGPAKGVALAMNSIDVEKSGAFLVAGQAPPSAGINLYLNNSFVAAAKAGADGHWSVTIRDGVPHGSFKVRADEIGDGSAKVVARVEVPFIAPAAQPAAAAHAAPSAVAAAAGAAPAPASPASSAPAPASDVVVASIQTATVVRGDSLWRISRSMYGQGIRYTEIFKANAAQIRNPSLIFPGQVFVVPKRPG